MEYIKLIIEDVKIRLKIYEVALEYYSIEVEKLTKPDFGLCYSLNIAFDTILKYYPYNRLSAYNSCCTDPTLYPEIAKQVPKKRYTRALWFPYTNTKSRIRILKNAIEDCKEQIKLMK